MISAWWLLLVPIAGAVGLFFGGALSDAKRADKNSEQQYEDLVKRDRGEV